MNVGDADLASPAPPILALYRISDRCAVTEPLSLVCHLLGGARCDKMSVLKGIALNRTLTTAAFVVSAVFLSTVVAYGQAPQAARPGQAPLAIPNPHYVSILMEIDVNKPAADVWNRIGKYCAIGEWFQTTCTMLSGKEGEVGSVRSVGTEVLVGKTELSYTYTQPVREGRPYNLYHGTLEARPVTASTSKLVYTLVFDNSMLADDDARAADIASRRERFTNALKNMKILAEGGTVAPAAAR
jgi:hypothetical protein